MSDDLSEYERHRLEHIKRNHEMLVRLGLEKPLVEKKATPKGQKRVRAAPVMPETLRRSGRVRGAAVEFDKEVIDKHGDDMDKQCAAKPGRKRERKDDDEDDDDEAARAEMLESTTAFLRAARAALLRFATSADGEAPTTDAAWREEALRRWGDLVGGGGGGETRDWETYVTSRLSTPPPPSPLDLLQEYYAADQWQLLCCCVLMSRCSSLTLTLTQTLTLTLALALTLTLTSTPTRSRCSSWDTKHRCISGFFQAYPTPSAFLEKV
jgi:methyl-CpG-binding domain protein 4